MRNYAVGDIDVSPEVLTPRCKRSDSHVGQTFHKAQMQIASVAAA